MSTSNVVKQLGDRGSAPGPGELIGLPRPLAGGRGLAAPPQGPHHAVLHSELWLCISKLLDMIMVG